MNELKLKQSFDNYFEAPIEIWKSFVELCNEVHSKKNEIIKEANRKEKKRLFYFKWGL